MKRLLVLSVMAFLAAYSAPTKLFAQGATETGTLTGTVTDPSGAVVPNAKVTVTNAGTGAQRLSETDQKGIYIVPGLLPAVYGVTVEASGFAKQEKRVQITVGATVSLDFPLTLGAAVSTTIEVVGAAGVAVNIENQTLSNVIDTSKIEELPTLTRNPYDLVLTAGTVSEDDPSKRGAGPSINGLRAAGTNVLLDGGANNDEFTGAVGQAVPLDAVQEFSVVTNNFTAEYGRADAGIVNVATKSGTNALHGTAYEFNRVSDLASNTFDNNASGIPKPVFTRNQFGYSVGGPAIKNKLFFFQSTEWTRVRSSAPQLDMIIDPALVALSNANTQAFFSAFGGTRPDLRTIHVFTKGELDTLGADPCATGSTTCAALPASTPMFDRVTYNAPNDSGGGLPQNTYSLVGRGDWNISPTTQFYSRYALENEIDAAGTINTSPYAGFETGERIRNNNILLALTHSFSSRWVSQTKFVFNRLNLLQPLGKNPASPTLYIFGATTATVLGNPVAFPGYNEFTPGSAIPFGGPQNFYQSYEDVSYTKGAHQFKFGGSYVFLQDNRAFGAYEESTETLGVTFGAAMDNLLNGQERQFQGAVDPQGKFPCVSLAAPTPQCTLTLPVSPPNFTRSNRYNEVGLYVQDSWKAKPRWTINLGLRWEYFGVQHNKNPRLDSNYYDAAGSVFQGIRNGDVALAPNSQVHGLWAKDWNNFAPRVGFAWDVFGNGKTALRGGYGIGYERNFGNVTFNVIQNVPNYAVVSLINGIDCTPSPCLPIFTDNAGPLAGTGTKPLPRVSLRNVNPHIRTAYAHLYSLTVEHQFATGLVAALDYSGSKGSELYSIENPNRPGSGNVYLGDPFTGAFTRLRSTQYSNINRRGNGGFSSYNALNARLDVRNYRNTGLTMRANYTWSHSFDNLSSTFSESFNDVNLGLLDPFNPALDRGPSEFDNRHRIALSAIWDVPYGRHVASKVLKRVFDGWEVAPIFTARTGAPFTIFDCTNAIQVCPRVFNTLGTSGISRTGPGNPPATTTPNSFTYLNFTNFDSSYVNPIIGASDFGPYPANMTGRGHFRGPGAWNLNFGIYKTTAVTERLNIQFRAELFNALNHSNLYVMTFENDVSSFGFMEAKRGTPVNAVALGLPGLDERRNVQLALKLIF
jgi:outer membrane receptor protein involved in Fe transport